MPGTEIAGASVPGLYGKLPARGDFVRRRLDDEFIEGWDAWLQRVMSESKQALGAHWLESFLSAPVWHFVVPAGMYSKAAWVGLMLPSVDRVGRYFPLTLAAPIHEDSLDLPSTFERALPWLDSIDSLALDALAPEMDLEAFDQRLSALLLPADITVALKVNEDDTVPLGVAPAAFQVWLFDSRDSGLQRLLQSGSIGSRSAALWMTKGGETQPPSLAACGGLIPGSHFCALLDGFWAEHSWKVAGKFEAKPAADPAPATDPAIYCDPQMPGVDLIHGQGQPGGEVKPLTASPSSENAAPMNTRVEE